MQKLSLDDTIAAISTPIGEGGIGIVRLSGREALSIADKIFVSKDGKRPSEYATYTTHYGWILDIDEVILTVMKAPKSYTKEDIVEINCHGGIIPLKKVLELVLANGGRLAEPGEFTKRAFLNGRIDLTQAEAVLDIIRAKTQKAVASALTQLEGKLADAVRNLREGLLDIKAHLEGAVDFPDEELGVNSLKEIRARLNSISDALGYFIKSSEAGKIIREGINCVICGKPNVGKSSLMNELLREERMIVTSVPGTTRDAVSEYVNIDGIPMSLVDTAGIVKTEDPVEKEGVIRSKLYIDKADLILFLMDAAAGFSEEDREVIGLIRDKEVICVLNKIDLPNRSAIDRDKLKGHFGKDIPFVEISVLKKINLETLLKYISESIWKGRVFADDYNFLINTRHKDSLLKALGDVREAIFSLEGGQTEEVISISVNDAIVSLGEITGESVSEEVLARIFGQFCVGK